MIMKRREVCGFAEKIEIVKKCKVCNIAMLNGDMPYIVPMNFGYETSGETLTLYFHSAIKGLKLDCLRQNPNVCVEMDCDHEPFYDELPCKNGFKFASIIGTGKAEFLTQRDEKEKGINALMLHQVGKTYTFTDQQLRSIEVIKVTLDAFTGKRRADL